MIDPKILPSARSHYPRKTIKSNVIPVYYDDDIISMHFQYCYYLNNEKYSFIEFGVDNFKLVIRIKPPHVSMNPYRNLILKLYSINVSSYDEPSSKQIQNLHDQLVHSIQEMLDNQIFNQVEAMKILQELLRTCQTNLQQEYVAIAEAFVSQVRQIELSRSMTRFSPQQSPVSSFVVRPRVTVQRKESRKIHEQQIEQCAEQCADQDKSQNALQQDCQVSDFVVNRTESQQNRVIQQNFDLVQQSETTNQADITNNVPVQSSEVKSSPEQKKTSIQGSKVSDKKAKILEKLQIAEKIFERFDKEQNMIDDPIAVEVPIFNIKYEQKQQQQDPLPEQQNIISKKFQHTEPKKAENKHMEQNSFQNDAKEDKLEQIVIQYNELQKENKILHGENKDLRQEIVETKRMFVRVVQKMEKLINNSQHEGSVIEQHDVQSPQLNVAMKQLDSVQNMDQLDEKDQQILQLSNKIKFMEAELQRLKQQKLPPKVVQVKGEDEPQSSQSSTTSQRQKKILVRLQKHEGPTFKINTKPDDSLQDAQITEQNQDAPIVNIEPAKTTEHIEPHIEPMIIKRDARNPVEANQNEVQRDERKIQQMQQSPSMLSQTEPRSMSMTSLLEQHQNASIQRSQSPTLSTVSPTKELIQKFKKLKLQLSEERIRQIESFQIKVREYLVENQLSSDKILDQTLKQFQDLVDSLCDNSENRRPVLGIQVNEAGLMLAIAFAAVL